MKMTKERWIIYTLSIIVLVFGVMLIATNLKSQPPAPPYESMRPPFGRDAVARAVCIKMLSIHKQHLELLALHPDGTELTDAGGGSHIVDAAWTTALTAEIAATDQLILDLQ